MTNILSEVEFMLRTSNEKRAGERKDVLPCDVVEFGVNPNTGEVLLWTHSRHHVYLDRKMLVDIVKRIITENAV